MEVFHNIAINLANFFLPFLVGSLIFFSIVVAPTTFSSLDQSNSKKFIRTIFPKLYMWSFIISLALAVIIITINIFLGVILFLVSFGFLFARQFLTNWINKISDVKKKNRQQINKFNLLHTLSVTIFIIQIILLIIVDLYI